MPEEKFETNLLRLISAELHLLSGMIAAREMFGKGYFSLGASEKLLVDQTVYSFVAANYQAATPESLKAQTTPAQVGFHQAGEKKP